MGASARRRTSKSPRISKTMRQEIVALESRSARVLTSLDQSCEALRQLEADIDIFMQDYYGKVGGYFEELARLEQELSVFQASVTADQLSTRNATRNAQTVQSVAERTNAKALDQDLKSLYRDMAKRAHPDTGSGNEDDIRKINDAYARRNLGELWKIRQTMELEKPALRVKDRVAQLESQHAELERALEEVENRRLSLEESEPCALMQRAFQLRICGQDFIQNVTDQVLAQIATKHRELVSTKIKHLYMDSAPAAPKQDMAV